MSKALFMLLALPLFGGEASDNGGWWSDLFDQKTVAFEEVVKSPQAHRGRELSFVIQFKELGAVENPYYTRFEKENFLNFSGWSEATPLWEKEAFDACFPYFFAARSNKEAGILLAAKTYDRFLVTARVEGVFRGKPWIEVLRAKPIEGALDEPSLIRMVKAFRLKKLHRFDAAAAEFAQLSMGRHPERVVALVDREQGYCLASANRFDEALAPLEKALGRLPQDGDLAQMLAFCREQAAKMPADPIDLLPAATREEKEAAKDPAPPVRKQD